MPLMFTFPAAPVIVMAAGTFSLPRATTPDGFDVTPEQQQTRRREGKGPLQTFVPKGGVLFRGPYSWHRGVPNRGATPRHMLAVSYASSRVERTGAGLSGYAWTSRNFAASAAGAFDRSWWPEGAFEHIHGAEALVDFNARFVDTAEVDHLGH